MFVGGIVGPFRLKSEDRAPLCVVRVIKIVVNVQIYMRVWAWNVKNDVHVKVHACRTYLLWIEMLSVYFVHSPVL